MDSKWIPSGSQYAFNRASSMVSMAIPNGFNIDEIWTQSVFNMLPIWYQHAFDMLPIGVQFVSQYGVTNVDMI